jgi:LmbE family N-acetylglucosaminyl deacetylase
VGDWKSELTGRVLVLVAHADDESVAYGALLQRMREAVLVIATDGAPQDSFFWSRFGSREKYAAVRREEARRAAEVAGVWELALLPESDERLEDQRLFLNLAAAYGQLEKLVERLRPEAIATLAYEGGHPDHDSCSVLGARLGERFGIPVWEAPAYNRVGAGLGQTGAAEAGELRVQEFVCANGSETVLELTREELERKRAMCVQYVSQGNFLLTFDAEREVVRPQVKYDYGRAPHEGKMNYEHWQWWMTQAEVSAKFVEFLGENC